MRNLFGPLPRLFGKTYVPKPVNVRTEISRQADNVKIIAIKTWTKDREREAMEKVPMYSFKGLSRGEMNPYGTVYGLWLDGKHVPDGFLTVWLWPKRTTS